MLAWIYKSGLCCVFLGMGVLFAQDNRPSEKEVLLEKTFIEASREKILGSYQEAIARYLEVLQKDNENAPANYELALLYQVVLQPDQALVRAERAATISPTELVYVRLYAQLLDKDGNPKKAADLYEPLVKLQPKNEELYYEWSDYLAKSARHDQAVKVLDAMEKAVGIREQAILRKSEAYHKLDKDKKAIEELEKLANKYPEEVHFQLHVAAFYSALQQTDKANQWYEKVLKHQPQNQAANLYMADNFLSVKKDTAKYLQALEILFEQGSLSGADKAKAIQNITDKPHAKYSSALLLLAQQVAQSHSDVAQGHLLYAQLLAESQQYAAAIEAYTQGLDMDKNQLAAWERLLEIYSRMENYKELSAKAREVVELFPNQAEGYYYSAKGYLQENNAAKALSEINYALPMTGSRPEWKARLQALLGQVYWQQKNNQAEKLLQDNAAQFPDNPYALAGAAWLSLQQKKYAEAKTQLEKALGKGGNTIPEIVEAFGDACFLTNDANNAVTYWNKAMELGAASEALKQKIQTRQLP